YGGRNPTQNEARPPPKCERSFVMPDALMQSSAGAAETRAEYFGKYRGTVVDNADPVKRGRLRVVVPAVLSSTPVWAMPCVPYAGPKLGFYAMPETGTGVWVEFEAGDPSY